MAEALPVLRRQGRVREAVTALRPWLALIGAVLAVAIVVAAYVAGRRDGRTIADGKQAAIERAVAAERTKRETAVAATDAAGAAKETDRQSLVREITRETHTITDRPVYRNVCIDADGVRLLDRATVVANGGDPGAPVVAASDAASAPAER